MEKNKPLRLLWILSVVVLIAGCGGGGGVTSNDNQASRSDNVAPEQVSQTTQNNDVTPEQDSQTTQNNDVAPEQDSQTTQSDDVAPEQDSQTTRSDDIVPEQASQIIQSEDAVFEQNRLAGQYTLVSFELFENGEVLTQDNFFQSSGELTVGENGSFTSDVTLNNEAGPSSSGIWTVTQAGTLRATDPLSCTSSSSYRWLNSSELQVSSSEEICGSLRQTKTWRINGGDGTDVVNEGPSYAIGDTGPGGGIVFAVNAGGFSGLEAARTDQSTDAHWCVDAIDIPGVDNTQGIDTPDTQTGAENTLAIIASCSTSGTPAEIASQYVWPNGQVDGILPNKEELNLLYEQRFVVGGFETIGYWSSSEFNSDLAWFQNFANAEQHRLVKDFPLRVRAVRAF